MALERDKILEGLVEEAPFLVIVGGGITGASIARDAARRGLSVLLVEQNDYASGTSSRSSKLVHGGFRYLQQYDFGLVFESTHERAVLQKIAGHLVRPLPFIYPVYKGDEYSFFKVSVGMALYEVLSGFQAHKFHRMHRSKKLLKLEPNLRSDGLTGGAVYYDAWTMDSVLTLASIQDAVTHGARCFNYLGYKGPVFSDGRVAAVELEDTVTGRIFRAPAHTVVHAAGAFTDDVLSHTDAGHVEDLIRPTKGVHLVVPSTRLEVQRAVAMHAPSDRRIVFAIPWGSVTLIGTTDTDFEGDKDRVVATAEDVAYLLETTNCFFPEVRLDVDDVRSTYAGLRPLVRESGESAYDTSREHSIVFDERGFLTICGGKLTTCRSMAEELLDTYMDRGGRERHHHLKRCETALRPIWGGDGMDDDEGRAALATRLSGRTSLSDLQIEHLIRNYGEHIETYLDLALASSESLRPLVPGECFCLGEIDLAVLYGQARSAVDVLKRRSTIFYKDVKRGLEIVPTVSQRIAELLGFDADWVQRDIALYKAEVALSQGWDN
jgi:glycerol-3-phosphate dehydrogenase